MAQMIRINTDYLNTSRFEKSYLIINNQRYLSSNFISNGNQ